MSKFNLGKAALKTLGTVGKTATKVAGPLAQVVTVVELGLTIKKGVDEFKKR